MKQSAAELNFATASKKEILFEKANRAIKNEDVDALLDAFAEIVLMDDRYLAIPAIRFASFTSANPAQAAPAP